MLTTVLLLLWSLGVSAVCGSAFPLNYNIHLFYYPWFGSKDISRHWYHWNQRQHNSPQDIASDFYPVLGPYDSCDSQVLAQHMQWIASAYVGTIVMSWCGQQDISNKCIPNIMNAAHKHQIKVAFHVQPYGGRTAESVVRDIAYISDTYGTHAAYFRDESRDNRDAFYIFDSLIIKDWKPIESLKKNHIILGNNYEEINKTHLLKQFSGFYPYGIGADPSVVHKWKAFNDFCKIEGCIWCPSVGPGFSDKRAKNHSKALQWHRNNGQLYDDSWNHLFASGIPHWVSITSFNQWNDGSMIEPSLERPPIHRVYQTYSGAFNTTGKASETAYLERTAHWVVEFTKRSNAKTKQLSIYSNEL